MMGFWDYFDSILCINLDRRTDRWAEAQAELELCLIDGCERVSAVETKPNGNPGCTASHRGVWRRVATGDLGERVLLFEDDFKWLTRADLAGAGYGNASDTMRIYQSCSPEGVEPRLTALLDHVPTVWDLLYLGGGYETAPRYRVNRHVIRNNGMLTTHAYAISRAYAVRLVAKLDAAYGTEELIGAAPDTLLAGLTKDPFVCAFTLTPRLFIQRPGSLSDLNPQPPGFPFSMTDPVHEMMV